MANKLVKMLDARIRLIHAASRLSEALGDLKDVSKTYRSALEDHELLNLADGRERLERELKYVDEVIKDLAARIHEASAKVKVKHT